MIALRQKAEHVRFDVVEPRDSCGLLAPDGFRKRTDLLADKNAEQSHQRDDWRRRRADIEQAIDDADEQASAKREKIKFHGKAPLGAETAPTGTIGAVRSGFTLQPGWGRSACRA